MFELDLMISPTKTENEKPKETEATVNPPEKNIEDKKDHFFLPIMGC